MAVAFAALACGESQPDPAPVRLVLEGHAQVQGAPLATNTALGEMLVSRCTSEISEAVTATRSIDLGAGPVEIPVVTFEFSYQADGTASGATPGGAPLPIHLEQTGESDHRLRAPHAGQGDERRCADRLGVHRDVVDGDHAPGAGEGRR